MRAYLWRRDPELADDVTAETFLVAWRRLDDIPAEPLPWLIGVARKIRLNQRRGDRRRDQLARRLWREPVATPDPTLTRLVSATRFGRRLGTSASATARCCC